MLENHSAAINTWAHPRPSVQKAATSHWCWSDSMYQSRVLAPGRSRPPTHTTQRRSARVTATPPSLHFLPRSSWAGTPGAGNQVDMGAHARLWQCLQCYSANSSAGGPAARPGPSPRSQQRGFAHARQELLKHTPRCERRAVAGHGQAHDSRHCGLAPGRARPGPCQGERLHACLHGWDTYRKMNT